MGPLLIPKIDMLELPVIMHACFCCVLIGPTKMIGSEERLSNDPFLCRVGRKTLIQFDYFTDSKNHLLNV